MSSKLGNVMSSITIHQPEHLHRCLEKAREEGSETILSLFGVFDRLSSFLADADHDEQKIDVYRDGLSDYNWFFTWRDSSGRLVMNGGIVYDAQDQGWRIHT